MLPLERECMKNIDKDMIGLIYCSEVRMHPSEIWGEFDDYEEAKEKHRKCKRCGFYFEIERGASEVEIEGQVYDDICEDCLFETEGGNTFDEIPYLEDGLEFYYKS